MEKLDSKLISITKLLSFLEKKDKTRAWLNTLSSRHKLIPKPIFLGPIMEQVERADLKPRQGRTIFYTKEIENYLEEVIDLHDNKGLSYSEIAERVKHDLETLNRLTDSELVGDRRLMPEGFYLNYKAAMGICEKYLKLEEDSKLLKSLRDISIEVRHLGRDYYSCINEMRKYVHGNSKSRNSKYEELTEKKEIIGEKLDLTHAIMDFVIRYSLRLLKKKNINIREWLNIVQNEVQGP